MEFPRLVLLSFSLSKLIPQCCVAWGISLSFLGADLLDYTTITPTPLQGSSHIAPKTDSSEANQSVE